MTDNRTALDQAAKELAGTFQIRARDNGDPFTCLGDNPPQWMVDAIHAAHSADGPEFSWLPDDFKYRAAGEIAARYVERASEDGDADFMDLIEAASDGFADDAAIYTASLTAWLASDVRRVGYCDDAVDGELCSTGDGLIDQLRAGLTLETREIAEALATAIAARAREIEAA